LCSLRSLAASEGSTLSDERTRAYAIYVLTRQGVVTTNFAAALQKRLETNHAKTYPQDIAAAFLAASYQLMKQQRLAERMMSGIRIGAVTGFETYYDPMGRDAQILYLLARHFPEQLAKLKPDALEALVRPIGNGHYNTYSSAHAILALDAYARAAEKMPPGSLAASEILRDGTKHALTLPPVLMPRTSFTPNAAKLQLGNKAELNAYWLVEQSGFDRGLPDKEIRNGLEVLREYVDSAGKPTQSVKVGEEVEVRLKLRAIDRSAIANVALVDLLPGGFDLVLNSRQPAPVASRSQAPRARPLGGDSEREAEEPEELSPEGARDGAPGDWQSPFGTAGSTWAPEFTDQREDRVVLYGTVLDKFQQFVYRIKATNAGTFSVPPAYGESMYERAVRGRSLGAKITVEKP